MYLSYSYETNGSARAEMPTWRKQKHIIFSFYIKKEAWNYYYTTHAILDYILCSKYTHIITKRRWNVLCEQRSANLYSLQLRKYLNEVAVVSEGVVGAAGWWGWRSDQGSSVSGNKPPVKLSIPRELWRLGPTILSRSFVSDWPAAIFVPRNF